MVDTFEYDFNCYFGTTLVTYPHYEYCLKRNSQDIFEYQFEQTYGHKYNRYDYHLEPGAREMERYIQEIWVEDPLTITKFYQDFKFQRWLKDRHYQDALEQCYNKNFKKPDVYEPLTAEECYDIFLENFGGEI